MNDGKKALARNIFADAMNEVKANGHPNPMAVWEMAIENASPQIMIRSKRIGWSVYQVPIEVPEAKKFYYACKWILDAARAKKGTKIYKKLADEMLAAYANQWTAVKKKEDVHKMAEANKAYAYLAKYI